MTYIVEFPSGWPEKLPNSDDLGTAAEDLGKKGKKLTEVYDATVTQWGALPSSLTVKNDQHLFEAFTVNVAPYADTVNTSLSDTKTALKDFASGVEEFKTRWTSLKEEVATYNALDAQPVDVEDRVDGTSYRTFSDSYDLSQRLITARDDYKTLVDTCVDAIKAADPSMDPVWTDSGTKAFIDGVKNQWNVARTTLDQIGAFRDMDGKLNFKFSTEGGQPTSVSEVLRGKFPDWLPEGVQEKLDQYLPDNPERFKRLPDGTIARYANGDPIPAYSTWSQGLRPMSEWFKDKFPGKTPGWLDEMRVRGMIDPTGANVGLVSTGFTMPGWLKGGSDRARKVTDLLDKAGKNPVVRNAGRVLGVADFGLTYYDSYTENYNETLRENPDWTPEQVRNEAVTSAAIVGTAENAGKIAGAVVGRGAGAAIGQAIIPIPGVGAAVGGFVGGIIGEQVGGFVGKHVGEFINDWRTDGFSGAVDGVKDKVSDAVDSVKDTASKVASKLNPGNWF
ncbi:hypothetical protein GCM10027591_01380 [Zhihengliuella somnathii]